MCVIDIYSIVSEYLKASHLIIISSVLTPVTLQAAPDNLAAHQLDLIASAIHFLAHQYYENSVSSGYRQTTTGTLCAKEDDTSGYWHYLLIYNVIETYPLSP